MVNEINSGTVISKVYIDQLGRLLAESSYGYDIVDAETACSHIQYVFGEFCEECNDMMPELLNCVWEQQFSESTD